MRKFSFCAIAVALALGLASVASANIWMDEDFEGTPVLVQGAGGTAGPSPANATLDTYSHDALGATVTASPLTQTGAKVTNKFFRGVASYKLLPAQVLSVGPAYSGTTNGNFQIFQFAANVDPIPAAGTVAEFRWNHDATTTETYSYFVRLVSTGTAVNIIAGEDLKNSPAVQQQIGTLSSVNDWKFISLVMQKAPAATTYTGNPVIAPLGALVQGMHFFCSSNTEAYMVPFSGNGTTYNSRIWTYAVTSGALYLDYAYWEGGMDGDGAATAASKVKPLNSAAAPASVDAWTLY